jgi:hypothetical protein
MMYGYVNGVRKNMAVSVEQAITQFLAFYKFDEEDVNALRAQYYEMEKLLREHEKGN